MKKLILFILLISSVTAFYGQQSYKIYTGPLLSVDRNSGKPEQNIVGTPYFNVNFMSAIIGNTNEKAPIRYDAYLDRIEVLADEKVYEVPRHEDVSLFKFEMLNTPIIYVKETDGYYFRLVDGKNQLLKKEKIKLKEVRTSIEPNSLIKEGYIKFEKQNPTYFIKTDEKVLPIPKSVKELLNIYPAHKEELEAFIKENNIKMKQEESLIKVVKFMNK
ncbi:hypothetical protein KSK37_09195 [Kaistella sp. DKR-2]|uniref:hypothetical protein n=1 Tax=Kaistella soli TaxID=2849654 RepID=UPI001C261EFB|nr:hypothetical protein [Kaistella soli]MBU8883258.1 hypothetical protein [Kaistella soli]